MPHLGTIPQEILEHIAYFVATRDLGPPNELIPLLLVNRHIAHALSAATNPHIYARLFALKFDLGAAYRRRRLTSNGAGTSDDLELSSAALCDEFRRRFVLMRRIRDRLDCAYDPNSSAGSGLRLSDGKQRGSELNKVLWMAYLMMLENDGKNERQLREYAGIIPWLRTFWFEPNGASRVVQSVKKDEWPMGHENISLGMWLFWYLLRPGTSLPRFV